jgi:hypothetical protein
VTVLTLVPESQLQELTESREARKKLVEILGIVDDKWGDVTSSLALIHEKLSEIADVQGWDLNDVVTKLEEMDEATQKNLREIKELRNEASSSLPTVEIVRLFSLLGISELQLSAVLQSGDPQRTLLHEVEDNLRRGAKK